MSTTIDQRVVEMRFDNAQFEQGISQSISSLDKLKASLNFDGEAAAEKLNVVVDGFSVLGTVAKRVVENFTDSAWARVVQTIKYLSVDQIASGWSKYGTLMDSVQTIMSATRQEWADQGEQMEYITGQIKKLNWYTDETSWNLVDMTSNIGKFVAAGVDIETATTAMIGIGSWAGQSGAKVDQMSRAMYNLSQAMALGSVRVQDWMSIENANMATKEFKDTVIQTALEMGTLQYNANGAIVAYDKFGHQVEVTAETFRSTLSAGWFTGDVLTTALKKYGDFAEGLHKTVNDTGATATELLGYIDEYKKALADGEDMTQWVRDLASRENISNIQALGEGLEYLSSDYNELGLSAFKASQECKTFKDVQDAMKDAVSSAWMGIFEAIIGNYLESKELWSAIAEELYEVFVDYLNDIRRALNTWGEVFGGRETLLEALWNFWYNIKDALFAIKEGFEQVFPTDKISSKLLYFVNTLKDFSEKVRLSDSPLYSDIQNLKDAAAAVAHVISRMWEAIKVVAKSIGDAWNRIFPSNSLNTVTLTMAIKYLAEWLEKLSEMFIMNKDRADKLERTFAGLFAIIDIVKELFFAIAEAIGNLTGETEGFADGALGVTATIGDWLVMLRDWIKENDIFRTVIGGIVSFIQSIPGKLDKVCKDLFGIGLDEVWINIKNAVATAWGAIVTFFTNLPTYANQASQALFGMGLDEVWEKIKSAVSDAWDKLKQFFEWARENLGKIFQSDDSEGLEESGDKFESFLNKITQALQNLRDGWQEVKPYIEEFISNFKDSFDFEMPSMEEMGKGLTSAGGFVVLLTIANLINTFITALKDLKKERKDIEDAVVGMFESIGGAAKSLSKRITADTFKTIATAILELAAAILILSVLDQDKMLMSTLVIGGLMAELALIMEEFDGLEMDKKKFRQIRSTITELMLVIGEITAAMILISRENIEGCKVAAVAIGALLAEIAVIIAYFGKMDDINEDQMMKAAGAMAIMGICLVEIAAALSLVGNLPIEGIIAGAIGISAILVILTACMSSLANSEGSLVKAAASSILMGLTLIEISAALALVGNLPVEGIIAGALGISAVLIIMSSVMALLAEAEGNIVKAAAASILMGIALLEVSVALAIVANLPVEGLIAGAIGLSTVFIVLAAAMALLAGSDGNIVKAAASLAIAGVGIILLAGALAVLSAIVESGNMWETLLLLAVALAAVMAAGAAAMYIGAGLEALGIAVALIGAGALMAGAGLLMFAEAVERLVAAGPGAIENMVTGISEFFSMIPDIATNVVHAIVNFIQEFVKMRDTFILGIATFITVICDAIIQAVPKIMETIGTIVVGILDLLVTLIPKFMEFLGVLLVAICNFIVEHTPMMVDTLIEFTRETLRGLVAITSDITAAAIAILLDVLHQLAENIGEIVSLLTQIAIETILGTLDGLIAEIPHFMETIWTFVLTLINTFADGLDEHAKELKESIMHLMESLWNAIKEFFGIHSPSTKFFDMAGDMIQGMINGLGEMVGKAKEAITNLADKVLTEICNFFGVDKPTNASEFGMLGINIINQLKDGINDMIDKVKDKIREVADGLLTKFCEILGIEKPKDKQEFMQFGIKILQQLNAGIYGMIGKVKDMIRQVAEGAMDKFNSFWEDFKDIGWDLIDGFKQGIKNAAYLVTSAVTKVGNDAINTVKSVLGIASPSKVFTEVGMYADEGLALGISKYATLVEDASEDVGFTAVDSVKDALNNIYNIAEEDLDGDPVIKPVLDLTDVMNGANAINNLLSGNRSMALAAINSGVVNSNITAQNNTASAFEQLRNTLGGLSVGNGGVTNNNVFNISGDNPRAIAEEVSIILQEQVEQENRAWAL